MRDEIGICPRTLSVLPVACRRSTRSAPSATVGIPRSHPGREHGRSGAKSDPSDAMTRRATRAQGLGGPDEGGASGPRRDARSVNRLVEEPGARSRQGRRWCGAVDPPRLHSPGAPPCPSSPNRPFLGGSVSSLYRPISTVLTDLRRPSRQPHCRQVPTFLASETIAPRQQQPRRRRRRRW